jgi:hypothetical protein
VEDEGSPLVKSLEKIGENTTLWSNILRWPYGHCSNTISAWAGIAEKHMRLLNYKAKQDNKNSFHEWIQEKLDEGDGALHRWTKNEAKPNSTVKHNGVFITAPMDLLEYHSEVWSRHWSSHLPDDVRDNISACQKAIALAKSDCSQPKTSTAQMTSGQHVRSSKLKPPSVPMDGVLGTS